VSEPCPDVVARFYDAVYAQVRDGVDNAFYLAQMASAGGPVLEIGSGTGRLLREACRRGVDAWGIDGEWAPGLRLRRFVSSAPADLARQTNHVRMTFVWDEKDGERRYAREFDMRFFFRFEVEHLVARSRLKLESVRGDFDGEPLAADSAELVVTCRRPE